MSVQRRKKKKSKKGPTKKKWRKMIPKEGQGKGGEFTSGGDRKGEQEEKGRDKLKRSTKRPVFDTRGGMQKTSFGRGTWGKGADKSGGGIGVGKKEFEGGRRNCEGWCQRGLVQEKKKST